MRDHEHLDPATIAAITDGFARTPHPGAAFLQGSTDGSEPADEVEPFRAITTWRDIAPALLDARYLAMSFLSDGGFRFFLPAWLVADVRGDLQTADPLFHLTSGFSETRVQVPAGGRTYQRGGGGAVLLNPRRYGAMTFEDAARHRLSVFCREEARAIVSYLAFRRETADLDMTRDAIDAARSAFWNVRATSAPTADALDAHVAAEQDYIDAITGTERDPS